MQRNWYWQRRERSWFVSLLVAVSPFCHFGAMFDNFLRSVVTRPQFCQRWSSLVFRKFCQPRSFQHVATGHGMGSTRGSDLQFHQLASRPRQSHSSLEAVARLVKSYNVARILWVDGETFATTCHLLHMNGLCFMSDEFLQNHEVKIRIRLKLKSFTSFTSGFPPVISFSGCSAHINAVFQIFCYQQTHHRNGCFLWMWGFQNSLFKNTRKNPPIRWINQVRCPK